MEEKTLKTIEKYNLILQDDRVLIALSGGADSVVLLHVLRKLGYKLYASHINHMIRGEEALRDEQFAINLCRELEVPIKVYQKNCPEYAKSKGLSLEEAARTLRYEALEAARELFGCQKIATAHTESDNQETMLIRLLRGTSPYGLRGIDAKREHIVRPLLYCSREEIIEYAEKHNLSYMTDSTNKNMDYLRNRIRHMLLPELKSSYNPNIASALSRLSENLKTDADYFAKETDCAYKEYIAPYKAMASVTIPMEAYKNLHLAILERLIRLGVKSVIGDDKDFDNIHTKMVLRLFNMRSGKKISLSKGLFAANAFGNVIIYKEAAVQIKEITLKIGDFIQIENTGTFISVSSKEINFRENFVKTCAGVFKCDKIMGSLVLRTRKAGDMISTPKGKIVKYKDFLIERKVPEFMRDNIYIVASDNKVLMMLSANPYAASDEVENEVLKIYIDIWRKFDSGG
ncbi:MAG: tRNA lysidine(34) synthetase TilS [Defluviitaleaceae bacterium]|nr:tRNA lysidine(34) synthetase TilS [Defluviitaleaceae bacterium]